MEADVDRAGRSGRYGVVHTLDQVFTAPGLVKAVLAAESGIAETYVCERCALHRQCNTAVSTTRRRGAFARAKARVHGWTP